MNFFPKMNQNDEKTNNKQLMEYSEFLAKELHKTQNVTMNKAIVKGNLDREEELNKVINYYEENYKWLMRRKWCNTFHISMKQ